MIDPLHDEMDVIREQRLRCIEAAARCFQGKFVSSTDVSLVVRMAQAFYQFVDTGRTE